MIRESPDGQASPTTRQNFGRPVSGIDGVVGVGGVMNVQAGTTSACKALPPLSAKVFRLLQVTAGVGNCGGKRFVSGAGMGFAQATPTRPVSSTATATSIRTRIMVSPKIENSPA